MPRGYYRMVLVWLVGGLLTTRTHAEDPLPERENAPTTEEYAAVNVANDHLRVRLYTPENDRAFYSGIRFNRGGIIAAVEAGGKTFFGPWRPNMARGQHDAITGPADEFDIENPPGYAEAEVGGVFIKIGVGALRRTEDQPYRFWKSYPMVDAGTWDTHVTPSSVRFRHVLRTDLGYAYELEKTVALATDDHALTLSYTLRNTGTRPLNTLHYHHNFCVFEGVETIGPDWSVTFDYDPEVREPKALTGAVLENRVFRFLEPLKDKQSFWASLSGTDDPAGNRMRVAHIASGLAIEIMGDQPLEKTNIYAQHRSVCPEPFVRIVLAPGESKTWSASYRFIAPAPGEVRPSPGSPDP